MADMTQDGSTRDIRYFCHWFKRFKFMFTPTEPGVLSDIKQIQKGVWRRLSALITSSSMSYQKGLI